ncbi:hypothetical protein RSOLAG1IB_09783 [Rhizoctonia solani AG-1 IB]|uniref:Jacalin-type lectin domain-containing protein n=1 Tax=Thanatephorus cucumeris (strain AG1-IB / isolate 7/3/14) TaxID=1108050 RepID=A0A0B7FT75_THACB|nr:hypothetical protein RSOLAG1IB_09783 [Rhizoctonia solani AG-1 IB]
MSTRPDAATTRLFWESLQRDTSEFPDDPDDPDYKPQSDFLRGVCFGASTEPYRSSRQAFYVRDSTICSVQPCQGVSTEEFYPVDDQDARYTHLGWPAPGSLPARPWDVVYSMPKSSSSQDKWVSRRMVVCKWTISLRTQDLIPVESFIVSVEAALKEPTSVGQIEALRTVFATWGEMIPLSAVIGCSLAATGILGSKQTLTGDVSTYFPPDRGPDIMQRIEKSLDITGNFERKFESRIQGGYPEIFSKSGFDAWLTNAVNTNNWPTWQVIKVNRAAPITNLLPKSLQEKVKRLFSYGSMVSRSPAVGLQAPLAFDGASLGIKDIKQIDFWQNGAILQDISIVYTDSSVAGPYGFGINKQKTDSLVLSRGEFITDVFVWFTPNSITSIQFAKNTSQVSGRYGVLTGAGDPAVCNMAGRALLGLSGSFTATSLTQLQAVWRNDIKLYESRIIDSTTIGSSNATIFNDFEYLGDPVTSRITRIQYRNTTNQPVARLQFTYNFLSDGQLAYQQTPVRGTDTGAVSDWNLEEDEYITMVKGNYVANVIYRLELETNKGNKRQFGQVAGDSFYLTPPNRDMVLYYILGKGAGYLQTLTVVWGMPPPSR